MTNIILCGGSGTRLWPISRKLFPKQFVKLFNDKSLFQLTVKRNLNLCDKQIIVSNCEQYFLVIDQLEELKITSNSYLLEPVGRNTAPAIALACFALDNEEIVLITPSDHLIKDEKKYLEVLAEANRLAQENNLVTFGIKPKFVETGFGYIEAIGNDVKGFHEKPDFKTAEEYLKSGNYYWNSGMFCFKAGVFLEELKKHSPMIYEMSMLAFNNAKKDDLIRIQVEDMEKIPSDSIDYAVIEKSNRVKVVPSDIGWSDVGSFDALAKEIVNDKNNNLIISNRLVRTIDIQDSIVIDTDDALLICKKGSSQKVKDIVRDLNSQNSTVTNIHLTGYRPWGSYTVLEDKIGYKIKRIQVKPGCRLSLQKHSYRNEHWIVLSGIATVTVGEKTFVVNPNESTYIKAGEVHRLENKGESMLVIIEAQVGQYTGEDDIIRIEDDYKRN